MNMLEVELSSEQINQVRILLDKELKTNGLDSLAVVVGILNALSSAKIKQEANMDAKV